MNGSEHGGYLANGVRANRSQTRPELALNWRAVMGHLPGSPWECRLWEVEGAGPDVAWREFLASVNISFHFCSRDFAGFHPCVLALPEAVQTFEG